MIRIDLYMLVLGNSHVSLGLPIMTDSIRIFHCKYIRAQWAYDHVLQSTEGREVAPNSWTSIRSFLKYNDITCMLNWIPSYSFNIFSYFLNFIIGPSALGISRCIIWVPHSFPPSYPRSFSSFSFQVLYCIVILALHRLLIISLPLAYLPLIPAV